MTTKAYLPPFWEYTNHTKVYSYEKEEADESVTIRAKLPGIKKQDIEVKYNSADRIINITVKNDGDVVVNQDILPQRQIDPEGIEAKLELGVLTITAPIQNTDKIIQIE